MDMFKMMQQAMSMKSKMKEVQQKLAGKEESSEHDGVRVTISCDLQKVQCAIDPEAVNKGVTQLSETVARTIEDALYKAKNTSAEELKQVMGGMDLGGLSQMMH